MLEYGNHPCTKSTAKKHPVIANRLAKARFTKSTAEMHPVIATRVQYKNGNYKSHMLITC